MHSVVRDIVSLLVEDPILAIPGFVDEKSSLRIDRLERAPVKTRALRMKIES